MGRCSVIRAIQCAIVIVSLTGGRVAGAQPVLGASFGYTHLSYPDTPRFRNDVLGIPGTDAWGMPGLRVGYHAPGGHWDVNADVGLVDVNRSGSIAGDETTYEVLPQIQGSVGEWRGFSPFMNGAVGVLHETLFTAFGTSITATRPVLGAGIGVRRPVSEGHGLVRLELRYDRVSERVVELTPSDRFTFPTTNLFSVKLGFDLLLAR